MVVRAEGADALMLVDPMLGDGVVARLVVGTAGRARARAGQHQGRGYRHCDLLQHFFFLLSNESVAVGVDPLGPGIRR